MNKVSACVLAAFVIVGAYPRSSHSQSAPIATCLGAHKLSDDEISNLDLAGKLASFRKVVQHFMIEKEFELAVVSCDNVGGIRIERDFEYRVAPPRLLKTTVLVTVDSLRKGDPNN